MYSDSSGALTHWIGRTAIERYVHDGEVTDENIAGSAYNLARWFSTFGHQPTLQSTLGRDFPPLENIRTVNCKRTGHLTPVVEIYVEKEGIAGREMQFDMPLLPLTASSTSFDIVGVTSIEPEFLKVFDDTEGRIKMLNPGDTMKSYSQGRLERGLHSATHVFLSEHESQALNSLLNQSCQSLLSQFNIEEIVETTDQKITVHKEDESNQYEVDTDPSPTDTIGAGDSFAAGYLMATLNDLPTDTRVVLGKSLATQTITHYGSLPMAVPTPISDQ